ncbi:MAG: aspartate carbamoyltransferase catalytic subunit [Acidimicrobiia bacterium]
MKHLLTLEGWQPSDYEALFRQTDAFAEVLTREVPKVPALNGKTVAIVFFENSTRTRVSFETAAKRLGADVMSLAVANSSVSKGESLRDTIATVIAMGADAVVIRHHASGTPHLISTWFDTCVINAGDGQHQHPTQGLLDTYCLTRHFGTLEGRRIGIIGDIRHSRVARSNVQAMTALGAEVVLIGPPTFIPDECDRWGVTIGYDLDAELGNIDVACVLRVQAERAATQFVPTMREYYERYGLTVARSRAMKEDAVVMHPGPMIRGSEIDVAVADGPRSLVSQQVSAGVAVRMSVLYRLLGSGEGL